MLRTNVQFWSSIIQNSRHHQKNLSPPETPPPSTMYHNSPSPYYYSAASSSSCSSSETFKWNQKRRSEELDLEEEDDDIDKDNTISIDDNDDDDEEEEDDEDDNDTDSQKDHRHRRKDSSHVHKNKKLKTKPSTTTMTQPNNNGRKRRGNLPKNVTAMLKQWLIEHSRHPYPTEEEKRGLRLKTNLTLNQISNWFINARRRILPLILSSPYQSEDSPHEQQLGKKSRRKRGWMTNATGKLLSLSFFVWLIY
ncbi:MAG: hypothetical protein EXX96DRAFT_553949 [Benjaminiella poitrasii]|nr:MAG: hypothetical protein EXX96DRAFT_553949 [Benjaminiella poitrasii]